jgi:hypothetical protein
LKFLYHDDLNARLVSFIGLCKLLIANKISRPEYFLSRMIVILYKSFEIKDYKQEDFHIKIYEIMTSFIFFYSKMGKNANKSILKSLFIIILCQLIGTDRLQLRSLFNDFQETKVEFINTFLKTICDNSQDIKFPRKILFKIFKFIYFLNEYMNNESIENERILNTSNLPKNKKINFNNKNRTNILMNLNKFNNKTKYDLQIFSDSTDEIFIKFITLLNETEFINSFSNEAIKEYEDIHDNDFKVDRNGIDFDIGERLKNYKEYKKSKEDKYKSEIEYFLSIFEVLKNEENYISKDDVNMIINEEDEEINDEESAVKFKKENRKSNKNNNNNINGNFFFIFYYFF